MFPKFLIVIPISKGVLAPTIFVTKPLEITSTKVRQHLLMSNIIDASAPKKSPRLFGEFSTGILIGDS